MSYPHFRLLCVGLPILILGLSCSGRTEQHYFPLKNGAKWEYALEYLSAGGEVVKGRAVTRIDGQKTIAGKRYFRSVLVTSGIPGAESSHRYFRRAPEGLYAIDGDQLQFGEYMSLPLPLEVGRAWKVESATAQMLCEAERIEAAELLDKRFDDCLRITCEGTIHEGGRQGSLSSITHQCPDVGRVKETAEFVRGSVRVTYSLMLEDFRH